MCKQTTTTTQVEPATTPAQAEQSRHDLANAEQNRRAREWLVANGYLPGPVPAITTQVEPGATPAQDAGAV